MGRSLVATHLIRVFRSSPSTCSSSSFLSSALSLIVSSLLRVFSPSLLSISSFLAYLTPLRRLVAALRTARRCSLVSSHYSLAFWWRCSHLLLKCHACFALSRVLRSLRALQLRVQRLGFLSPSIMASSTVSWSDHGKGMILIYGCFVVSFLTSHLSSSDFMFDALAVKE